ncbi:uncharacterized protein LOC144349942 [Saccoglossus kowalevskii]
MVLAVFTCLFCFWPVGLVAIIMSCVALSYRRRKNDLSASRMTTVSIIISVITLCVGIIGIVVIYFSAKHYTERHNAYLTTAEPRHLHGWINGRRYHNKQS